MRSTVELKSTIWIRNSSQKT